MGRYLVLVLAAVMFPAAGQTVQKCVGRGGAVTFTSGDCPTGQAQAATYAAQPERLTAQQVRDLQARRLREDANSRYLESLARGQGNAPVYRTPNTSNSRHTRCDAAKRHRDQQIELLGLRRTHADLRRWDDYVYDACK